MSNILHAVDHAYPQSHLIPLLDAIKTALQQKPTWIQREGDHLILHIDHIAQRIAERSDIPSPLPIGSASVATAYTHDMPAQSDAFYKFILAVQEDVMSVLEHDSSSALPPMSLLKPLSDLLARTAPSQMSLYYPFKTVMTQYRYMAQVAETNHEAVLRLHRVTCAFHHIEAFQGHLETALQDWCQQRFPHDHEDVLATFEDEQSLEHSRYARLVRMVDTETLGKLRRAIYPHCFAFLRSTSGKTSEGEQLCRDMQHRLERFEAFLRRTDKPDSYWQVRFEHWEGDLRDLFSSSDALDSLPIIPQLKDKIGETTDPTTSRKEYLWSLSFKLNGPVHRDPESRTSFQYHIDHYIDPNGSGFREEEQETNPDRLRFFYGKVIQRAILYTFCFYLFGKEEEYISSSDPQKTVDLFEKTLLHVLQKGTDENKKKRLRLKTIADGLRKDNRVETHIKTLAGWIQERNRAPHPPDPRTIDLQIVVHTSLLHQDVTSILEESSLFCEVLGNDSPFGTKPALRHMSVQPSGPIDGELVKLDVRVRLDCLHTVHPGEPEQTQVRTVFENTTALPVLFYPQPMHDPTETYQKLRDDHPWICIPYAPTYLDDHQRTYEQRFRYRFTFLLLSYVSLVVVADHSASSLEEQTLFLPLLRLHAPDTRTIMDPYICTVSWKFSKLHYGT